MWDFLFLFSFIILFILPFVPAFVEWGKKEDATSLRGVESYDIHHNDFVENFKSYLKRESSLPFFAVEYCFISDASPIQLSLNERAKKIIERYVVVACKTVLPGEYRYQKDIYAQKNITLSDGAHVYSVLCEQDAFFSSQVRVDRWVHAINVIAGPHCSFGGRVSARDAIFLHPTVAVTLARAPRIVFGFNVLSLNAPREVDLSDLGAETDESTPAFTQNRKIIDGDYWLVNESDTAGDYVVRGTLTIGRNCVLRGSVKAYGEIKVGENSEVRGSLISNRNIHLGRNSRVIGPVVSESELRIAAGSRIGKFEMPTSLICQKLAVENDVILYGALSVASAIAA